MPQKDLVVWVAAILSTLHELGTGTPESMLYLALGMDHEKFAEIRGLLLKCGWISVSGNYIELTASGKQKAEELAKATKKGPAE